MKIKFLSTFEKENWASVGQCVDFLKLNKNEQNNLLVNKAISHCTFFEGRRHSKHFIDCNFIIFDCDNTHAPFLSLVEAIQKFKDTKCVIGTTKSHQKEKKGIIEDRFRIIISLEESINHPLHLRDVFEFLKRICPWADRQAFIVTAVFQPLQRIILNQINDENKSYFKLPPFDLEAAIKKIEAEKALKEARFKQLNLGEKGILSKETRRILKEGFEPGNTFQPFFKCVLDCIEQNYSQEEAQSLLNKAFHNSIMSDEYIKRLEYIYLNYQPTLPARISNNKKKRVFKNFAIYKKRGG